jgi:hypothetical protein
MEFVVICTLLWMDQLVVIGKILSMEWVVLYKLLCMELIGTSDLYDSLYGVGGMQHRIKLLYEYIETIHLTRFEQYTSILPRKL